MPTDPTEDRKSHKTCLLVMAGLPIPTVVSANLRHSPVEKGEIVQFLWKMKTNNYSEDTIERYGRTLATLVKRGADLKNAEDVKDVISRQPWSEGTKANTVNAIQLFYKYHEIKAEFPAYKQVEKIPFIPTQAEIDQLVSASKHQLATFIQVVKETGARYGEALNLKWTDYNTEQATLAITPEKGSNPRVLKVSNKLQTMLSTLPQTSNKIFTYREKKSLRRTFERARKRVARNTGNPRILQIHFHTLRHWKATTEFHKTNNVILVMKLLGHKCLNNTQRYIQLLPDLSDDFVCEVAHNTQEVCKLVENGYTYVQTIGNEHIYKKRK
jgi:integrase